MNKEIVVSLLVCCEDTINGAYLAFVSITRKNKCIFLGVYNNAKTQQLSKLCAELNIRYNTSAYVARYTRATIDSIMTKCDRVEDIIDINEVISIINSDVISLKQYRSNRDLYRRYDDNH